MARNQSLLLALVVALVAAWGVSCFVAPMEGPTAAPKQLRALAQWGCITSAGERLSLLVGWVDAAGLHINHFGQTLFPRGATWILVSTNQTSHSHTWHVLLSLQGVMLFA